MRKISAANSVASSPPVPARISSTTFFSSFGSLGSSRTFSSSFTAVMRSRVAASLFLRVRPHLGDRSRRRACALLSSMPRFRSLYSRYFSTIVEISLCAFAVFWYRAESLTISGEASASVSVLRISLRFDLIVQTFFLGRCAPHRPKSRPPQDSRGSYCSWLGARVGLASKILLLPLRQPRSSRGSAGLSRFVHKSQPRPGACARIFHQRHVSGAGDDHNFRAFDALKEQIGARDMQDAVLVAPHNQGRRGNIWQPVGQRRIIGLHLGKNLC